jgi:hypothetical protein
MAKGPVICAATGLDEWAIETCRDYIKRFDLTREDVKIVQEDEMTLVVAKRDCSEKLKGDKHGTSNL